MLNISTFIFPFISYPYVSRIVGPAGVGKVSTAISIVAYFNMIAQLGIPTYGIRACAKVRDDRAKLSRTASELLVINMIMGALSLVTLGALVIIMPQLANDRLLYIVMSTTILFSCIGMEWLFKALEEYTFITKWSILFKAIACILMFALVRTKNDYVWYGVLTIFAASASAVVNFVVARKYVDIGISVKAFSLKPHMRPAFTFFALTCATTVYTNLDTVMLAFMTSDVDVGYYSTAVKVKTILIGLVTSLATVLLPRASYYVEKHQFKEFWGVASKAMQFVVQFAIPLMLYSMLYAGDCIYLLSGADYSGAIIPMIVIMPTLLFIGITNVLGIQIMVPLGREKQVLISVILGAVVDCVINVILIPKYASLGAAIGTTVAEAVVLIYQIIVLWSDIKEVILKLPVVRSFIFGIFGMLSSFILVKWIDSSTVLLKMTLSVHSFVVLAITSVIFFGVYILQFLIFRGNKKRTF